MGNLSADLGVFGKEGPAWWYRSGGWEVRSKVYPGMADDEAAVLEPQFSNAEAPPRATALVMSADERGLVFEQYVLGPPLPPHNEPHRVHAVLHDWLVVARSGEKGLHLIARRPR